MIIISVGQRTSTSSPKNFAATYAISISTDPSTYCDTCKIAPKAHHKYPTGAYQLSETIFERLEDVKINVPLALRLFSHLIIFNFQSITVPDKTIRNTELTPWIGKHVPISVSISSNLFTQPIFICNEDPLQLIRDFVSNLTHIAEKSTLLKRKTKLLRTGTRREIFGYSTIGSSERYQGNHQRRRLLTTKLNPTRRMTKTFKLGD